MEPTKVKEGGVGLSYPMLTRGNYTAWSLKMKVYMQAHGVWEAVEPKDAKAKVEERKDKIALAVIYQGIPEDMLLSLADKSTAKEAWDALKTMCLGAERVQKAKVQTLKAEGRLRWELQPEKWTKCWWKLSRKGRKSWNKRQKQNTMFQLRCLWSLRFGMSQTKAR